MKKILLTAALSMVLVLGVCAQEHQKFSPEKFQADLEQFITTEAGLTAEESAKFFPLYHEMQQKQRAIYKQMKDLGSIPTDEASCKRAVQQRDEYDLELKSIQQNYHNKFLRVLSATKVYKAIMAEDRFHRRAFRNMGAHHRGPKR